MGAVNFYVVGFGVCLCLFTWYVDLVVYLVYSGLCFLCVLFCCLLCFMWFMLTMCCNSKFLRCDFVFGIYY